MENDLPYPWFKWYPADWSSKVSSLSLAAEACLVELVNYHWIHNYIPADRNAQARICRGAKPDELEEAHSLYWFKTDTTDPSRLYSPAMRAIKEEAVIRHHRAVESGRKGAKQRFTHKPRKTTPKLIAMQ